MHIGNFLTQIEQLPQLWRLPCAASVKNQLNVTLWPGRHWGVSALLIPLRANSKRVKARAPKLPECACMFAGSRRHKASPLSISHTQTLTAYIHMCGWFNFLLIRMYLSLFTGWLGYNVQPQCPFLLTSARYRIRYQTNAKYSRCFAHCTNATHALYTWFFYCNFTQRKFPHTSTKIPKRTPKRNTSKITKTTTATTRSQHNTALASALSLSLSRSIHVRCCWPGEIIFFLYYKDWYIFIIVSISLAPRFINHRQSNCHTRRELIFLTLFIVDNS